MDHRKSRIKKELEAEQRGETTNPMLGDGTLQPGAFRQARSHQKEPVMDTATLGRAVLIVILGGACLGYVFYGVNALYIGGLALVSYIYFRIRKG